jgi:ketosteroid isomerase-like protein
MIRLAALALLPLAIALGACQPSEGMQRQWVAAQEDRTALLAAQGARWRTLYQAGDWEGLRALYADDAVLMTQGSPKIEGADNIVAFLQRIPKAGGTVQFVFENEDVDAGPLMGFTHGFVTARYRMTITMPGAEPQVIAGRSFLVYEWDRGAWKLWRDIDNTAPDATAADFSSS